MKKHDKCKPCDVCADLIFAAEIRSRMLTVLTWWLTEEREPLPKGMTQDERLRLAAMLTVKAGIVAAGNKCPLSMPDVDKLSQYTLEEWLKAGIPT